MRVRRRVMAEPWVADRFISNMWTSSGRQLSARVELARFDEHVDVDRVTRFSHRGECVRADLSDDTDPQGVLDDEAIHHRERAYRVRGSGA